jgi:hypothetical protein
MRKAWLVLTALLSMACGGEADGGGGENGGASSGGTAGVSTGGAGGTAAASSGGAGGTAGASSGGAGGTVGGSGGMAGSAGASSGGAGGTGQAGTSGGSSGSGGTGGSGGIPPDVGSGQCQDFTPCGGSLTGAWNYTGCTDPELQIQSLTCNVIDETVTVYGELEFRTDGTATATGFIRSQATLGASCSCSLPSGFLFACTAGANGSCTCDSTDNPTENSTYTTSGNLLTNVRASNTSYLYYCRQADEVWMRGVNDQGLTVVYHLTPK